MTRSAMVRFLDCSNCVLLVLVGEASSALAEKRVALVRGNNDYAHAANLRNPSNGAIDIAAVLRRLDFDVWIAINYKYSDMRRALRDFGHLTADAGVRKLMVPGE